MIPVAADHLLDVAHGQILPGLVADMLPAGDFFKTSRPASSQASRKCVDCG
jgi:hypothetical protein